MYLYQTNLFLMDKNRSRHSLLYLHQNVLMRLRAINVILKFWLVS
jgi:hypothetical protein